MNKSRYFADIFMSVIALVFGLALAAYFHAKWYYGGWMSIFGDPPNSNPAYERFVRLFVSAPYSAAGLGAGLLAGFGHPQTLRIFVRSMALLFLFVLLASRNSHLAISVFIPVAVIAFLLSAVSSCIYFWLLMYAKHSKHSLETRETNAR